MRLFTRCRVCNAAVEPVDAGEVQDRVPARVWTPDGAFARCPDCGRVYWEGSHTDRMRSVLARVFDEG